MLQFILQDSANVMCLDLWAALVTLWVDSVHANPGLVGTGVTGASRVSGVCRKFPMEIVDARVRIILY